MDIDNFPLKILHILDHGLPLYSGYAFRSHHILQAQRRRGWQPVALTSSRHAAAVKSQENEREHIQGVTYYRSTSSASGPMPLAAACRQMVALARRIRQVAEHERPDLLHAHSPVLNALPALLLGRRLRIPVVYEIRAFWEDAAVDHGTYRQGSWKYRLVRSVESWVCRRAMHVAVICEGLKDDLLARGLPAEDITVVANGIAVDEFCVRTPDARRREAWGLAGKTVIGFIGSFYHYEGLDLLVEAFTSLKRTEPNIALLLVGEGPMTAALKARIKQRCLDGSVLLPGKIPHHHIADVYALMDILAYPRYSVRLTELVTPLKPLEAMAAGKALVASDVGGHRELIRHGETGLLFPAGSMTGLAAAVQSLLDQPYLRQTLEQQGPVWVRQHRSWDKTTAAYSYIYSRALARCSTHPIQGP